MIVQRADQNHRDFEFLKDLVLSAADILDLKYGGQESYTTRENDVILYIKQDNMFVCVLDLFLDYENEVWIGQAWTMPNFRSQGLYRRCFEEAKKFAKIHNKKLKASIHSQNFTSQIIHQQLGMNSSSTVFEI